MRNTIRALTIVLLAGACSGAPTGPEAPLDQPPAGAGPIRFSTLRPGDRVEVRYHSKGCFHDDEQVLTFTADTMGAALGVETLSASLAPGWRFAAPGRLSAADLARVDRVLAFYRSAPGSHLCTTRERVSLALYHDGERVSAEHYEDASCGTYYLPDVLSFGMLLRVVPER